MLCLGRLGNQSVCGCDENKAITKKTATIKDYQHTTGLAVAQFCVRDGSVANVASLTSKKDLVHTCIMAPKSQSATSEDTEMCLRPTVNLQMLCSGFSGKR